MCWQARIDAPLALHPIVIRGIGGSEFVQKTLEEPQEAYARKTRLQWAGVDLSGVIVAVCTHFGIDEKEPVSASKRQKVAHARAVVSPVATQGLSISGGDVARRPNLDRSAVSRAVRRAAYDPDLMETAGSILEKLGLADPATSQH